MEFSQRKLPPDAAPKLRSCAIASVKPYALMLAPAYVYMRRNEKFVSVKAPLDFFTPEELQKLSTFQMLYFHGFVDRAIPFSDAGRQVRAILSWKPKQISQAGLSALSFPEVPLPPAPYELSDAILRSIGRLWFESAESGGAIIEPFFASVFTNELCDTLPAESLRGARDTDVRGYELAIFRSSWAVFLALHLGHYDLDYLNRLRLRAFEESRASTIGTGDPATASDELLALVAATLKDPTKRAMREREVIREAGRISEKLAHRLVRVRDQFVSKPPLDPTIFGPGGFAGGASG